MTDKRFNYEEEMHDTRLKVRESMEKVYPTPNPAPTTPSQWESIMGGIIDKYVPPSFTKRWGCYREMKQLFNQTLQQERQRWVAELEGKKEKPLGVEPLEGSRNYIFNQGLQTAINLINGEKE